MNYIKQLNEFYSTLDYKPLPTNSIAVYFILLQVANKTGWIDKFKVANTVLMSKCDLNLKKLIRARNSLINQGYITYYKGKNQTEAPSYSIEKLYKDTPNGIADDTPIDTPNGIADGTINKQNKTKEYIDHFDIDNTYSSSEDEQNSPLLSDFEKLWKIYPSKKGKNEAYRHYNNWLKGKKYLGKTKKLSNKEMWFAIEIYKYELKKEKREDYAKNGSTFFNEAICEYSEKYKENPTYWEKEILKDGSNE